MATSYELIDDDDEYNVKPTMVWYHTILHEKHSHRRRFASPSLIRALRATHFLSIVQRSDLNK